MIHGVINKRHNESIYDKVRTNYSSWHQREEKTCQETLEMSHPIYVFFKVIDDGVIYASEEDTPSSLAQSPQMSYQAVISAGIYAYECKD